jgi:branched-chain amino acid transport system ATP-binding protein
VLLEVEALTTAYRGLIAISDVSIGVAEGEIVVVAGANGAGKSTLLKSIAGMEKPRSGTVSFGGERIEGREAPAEQVFSLFPRLKERLPQRAETLSGGEQQMLAIGRALMTRPRLLMLDEPSQGIMPKLVDEIFQAVLTIRATGVTILLVEQRLVESLEIADRAYVLQTGRVVLAGTAAEVRDDPEIRKAYLGI